jgi:hypothetical protein
MVIFNTLEGYFAPYKGFCAAGARIVGDVNRPYGSRQILNHRCTSPAEDERLTYFDEVTIAGTPAPG